MTEQNHDIWADYYASAGTGGGVVCKVLIRSGWKSFASGYSGNQQGDTFFPCPPEAVDAKAFEKAKAQASALQSEYSPSFGTMTQQFLTTANLSSGEPVNWNFDQFDFVAGRSKAAQEIVNPALQKVGIAEQFIKNGFVWEGWVRIGWANDPRKVELGKTRTLKDGTEGYAQIAYVTEVFENEEAARAAIGVVDADESKSAPSQGNAPDGWEKDTWESVWPEIHEAKENGASLKSIADDYGVPVSAVSKALKDYIPL